MTNDDQDAHVPTSMQILKRSQPKCIERNHIDCIKQGALVSAPARKGSCRYDQLAARQVPDSNPGGPGRIAG